MASSRSRASAMSVPSVAMMKVMALPRALVVGRPHRHRDAGRQRRLRQAVALRQEAPQRAAANRQHHVVERALRPPWPAAQALHGKLLRGEAPLLAHPAVEHRQRRIVNGTTMPSPVADALEHLAEGGDQLRHESRLAAAGPATAAARHWPWCRQGTFVTRPRAPRGKPEAQNGGSFRLFPRSVDMARCSSFMPLTPSISEWCILMNRAKRCPSSPSMMVHSQGGRSGPAACSAGAPPVRPVRARRPARAARRGARGIRGRCRRPRSRPAPGSC
jgi:hypothetical protein